MIDEKHEQSLKQRHKEWEEEEKEHGHSISSAVLHAPHAGKAINIIDTPGYPDFVGPSIKAIPSAETALVVISASAGIETNTRKLYALAEQARLPRVIVINKIDSDNIDIPELLKAIKETFGPQCRLANLPAQNKKSVIDCIENKTGDSPLGERHRRSVQCTPRQHQPHLCHAPHRGKLPGDTSRGGRGDDAAATDG